MKVGKDKYHCRIYANRLGQEIDRIDDKIIKCIMREDYPHNFEGCPYNRPEWEEK